MSGLYRISEEELNEIKEKFEEIISYSQGINQPKVDKLFDLWLENKKSYIELFDGKLIYELPEPVSFEMTEKDKRSKFEDFLTSMDTYVNINDDFIDFLEVERLLLLKMVQLHRCGSRCRFRAALYNDCKCHRCRVCGRLCLRLYDKGLFHPQPRNG